MSQADVLFELGTEELPAGPLTDMAQALHDGVINRLNELGLKSVSSKWFATPRRLAVHIKGLALEAPAIEREILGPPAASAKDADGNWTGAAVGFAKKQGLSSPDELQIIDNEKGPRLGLHKVDAGAKAEDVLSQIVADAVAEIPVAKRMRWGRGRSEFLRPVQWLVLLLGDEVLPLQLLGLTAGRETRGHRFHHSGVISLSHADEYESKLFEANVIADFAARQAKIKAGVEHIAADRGLQAVIGDDLLHEVTGLVEWPVPLMGSFEEAFLEVPAEALISSMKEHQKYFHVVDSNGALQPLFITVSNIESSDPQQVISGNERVIRPRLSDAKFFFDTDKKTPLGDRAKRLETVVFQQKLGTLADKTNRIVALGNKLAALLGANAVDVARAAALAKCDLVSDMVLEFPELQGIAGANYARHDGENNVVASAVEQHYWPRFAGDNLPETKEAACVAMADRLDTLVGIFGIGQTPTGSKDPFGLRRAALAVIRMLIELKAEISLADLLNAAADGFDAGVLEPETEGKVSDYILERLRAFYEDQGISVDVLRAVTATGITVLTEIDARVKALNSFAETDAAVALAAANKRVANILAKSDAAVSGEPDSLAFVEPQESALYDQLSTVESSLAPYLEARDYHGALTALADLRVSVDDFFDNVMVNAEDPALKVNRLALLYKLRSQFLRVADIAEIATK